LSENSGNNDGFQLSHSNRLAIIKKYNNIDSIFSKATS